MKYGVSRPFKKANTYDLKPDRTYRIYISAQTLPNGSYDHCFIFLSDDKPEEFGNSIFPHHSIRYVCANGTLWAKQTNHDFQKRGKKFFLVKKGKGKEIQSLWNKARETATNLSALHLPFGKNFDTYNDSVNCVAGMVASLKAMGFSLRRFKELSTLPGAKTNLLELPEQPNPQNKTTVAPK